MAYIKERRGEERTFGPITASKASVKERRVPKIGSGKGDDGLGVGDERVRVDGAGEHAQISGTKAPQNLKLVVLNYHTTWTLTRRWHRSSAARVGSDAAP